MDLSPETSSVCYVCNERRPNDVVLTFGEHNVCADCKEVYLQAFKEGVSVPRKFNFGRSRNIFVVSPGAELPDRCVRCNAPATKQPQIFKRLGANNQPTAKWSAPLSLNVGVCEKCRKRKKTARILTILGVLLIFPSIATIFLMKNSPLAPFFVMHGAQLICGVFIVIGATMYRSLRIIRVKNENLYIIGAGDKFLDSLDNLRR